MADIASYSYRESDNGTIYGYAHIVDNDVETCYTYTMSAPLVDTDITEHINAAYIADELVYHKRIGHIDRSGDTPVFIFNRD